MDVSRHVLVQTAWTLIQPDNREHAGCVNLMTSAISSPTHEENLNAATDIIWETPEGKQLMGLATAAELEQLEQKDRRIYWERKAQGRWQA